MGKNGRVGVSTVIGYGIGNLGYALMFAFFNTYMVLYLNTIIMLPAAIVGMIVLIVRITDAFTDIGFGMIGDRTKTKMGSYRPWLLGFAIPAGVFTALYFSMPDSVAANQGSATAWAAIFFFLAASVAMTVLQTSMGALGIVGSDKQEDRKLFGILRQWGYQGGGLLVYLFGMPLLLRFSGEGATAPAKSGFSALGIVFGIIIAAATLFAVFTVKERVPINRGEKIPFKSMGKAIGKNPIAWGAMMCNIANQMNLVIAAGLNSYLFIYVFKRADMMTVAMTTSMVCAILFTTFVTPQVTTKIPRKIYMPIAQALMIIGFVLIFVGTSENVMSVAMFTVGYTFFNIMTGLVNATVFQTYPDATDYGEYLAGVQIPGLVNAIATYATKIAMGLGTIIVTACLTSVHFDAALGQEQAAETLAGIRQIYLVGNIIIVCVSFVGFLIFSTISQQRLAEIREENARKRAAKEAV